MDVDLAAMSDEELHATFDELCRRLGDADADPDDKRADHHALMDVTHEMGRRTDAWIAERQRGTVSG